MAEPTNYPLVTIRLDERGRGTVLLDGVLLPSVCNVSLDAGVYPRRVTRVSLQLMAEVDLEAAASLAISRCVPVEPEEEPATQDRP